MKIEIVLIDIADKKILSDMLWDYEKEMVGEKAEEYKYLDSYWEKPNRYPYFIKVDGKIAGFALINSYLLVLTEGKTISEFYVKKEFRKNGIGSEAARLVFTQSPGKWENRQIRENPKAHTFWLKFIAEFTNNNFEETEMNNEKWNGWIQTFDNSLSSK
ncbi:MAG: GNAT family N-acetyltransferase [Candidatus Shapirobacteria bacterium]|jgi:predicted acetyltransferase